MQILLFGKTSSVTTTIQTMLQSIEGWSVQRYSDLTNLNKPEEENAVFNLLVANLEDFEKTSLKVVSQICTQFPDTPLLVIHSYLDKSLIKPMITAGATGYIHNNVSDHQLINAVQKVASGTECIIAEST